MTAKSWTGLRICTLPAWERGIKFPAVQLGKRSIGEKGRPPPPSLQSNFNIFIFHFTDQFADSAK